LAAAETLERIAAEFRKLEGSQYHWHLLERTRLTKIENASNRMKRLRALARVARAANEIRRLARTTGIENGCRT